MINPPNPGLPPLLLALLARLAGGWRSIGALGLSGDELGHFIDGAASLALYVDGTAGPGSVAWALCPSTSPGLGPFAVTANTACVLAGADLASDGALLYQGKRYRLAALVERGQLTATLTPAETTSARKGDASSLDPTPPDPH